MHLMKHIEVLALRLPQFLSLAKESTRLSTYCRELVVNGQIDITLYLDGILGYVPNLDSLELWSNRLSPEEFVVVTQDESTSEVNDTDLGETSLERVDGVIGVLTLLIFVMCISQVFA